MRTAKDQASLRIRAVSPESPLLAHTSSESRGTYRQKARSLAPLNGWACAVKICHGGMLEDTNSLDGAHLYLTGLSVKIDCQRPYANDCQDVKAQGFTESGVYHVTPAGTYTGYDVYCDMDTDNGGWLVRINFVSSHLRFHRSYAKMPKSEKGHNSVKQKSTKFYQKYIRLSA